MSPLVILLPRKGYLQHFGSKIVKIVRCYCHDLGQSERNIFDFSLCVFGSQGLTGPAGGQWTKKLSTQFMKVTLFPTTTTGTLPRSRPSLICEYIPETYSNESGQSKSKTKMYALASRIPYAEIENSNQLVSAQFRLDLNFCQSILN